MQVLNHTFYLGTCPTYPYKYQGLMYYLKVIPTIISAVLALAKKERSVFV